MLSMILKRVLKGFMRISQKRIDLVRQMFPPWHKVYRTKSKFTGQSDVIKARKVTLCESRPNQRHMPPAGLQTQL